MKRRGQLNILTKLTILVCVPTRAQIKFSSPLAPWVSVEELEQQHHRLLREVIMEIASFVSIQLEQHHLLTEMCEACRHHHRLLRDVRELMT